MVNQTADRFFTKSGGWLNLYIIAASLAMAMLGLVMLFSAGAVKGAQSLLVKQLIWLGISMVAFLYAAFMDLTWLRNRSWLLYGLCVISLLMVLVPRLGVKVNGCTAMARTGSSTRTTIRVCQAWNSSDFGIILCIQPKR